MTRLVTDHDPTCPIASGRGCECSSSGPLLADAVVYLLQGRHSLCSGAVKHATRIAEAAAEARAILAIEPVWPMDENEIAIFDARRRKAVDVLTEALRR